jgi:two-component system, OmpR family, sensor histidine kinase SenX3
MASLSDELIHSAEAIAQGWYETWIRSSLPHADVAEHSLKDNLTAQLRLIGEQLRNLGTAQKPEEMWKLVERLNPDLRIAQNIPIEEVVQEYCILVDVVRDWIEERTERVTLWKGASRTFGSEWIG